MNAEASPSALDDVLVERDFLACLVDLVSSDAPDALVVRALRLVAQRAGAQRAYIQIGEVDDPHAPAWSAAIGFDTDERDAVRALLSTTILREALERRLLIESSSAATDPRFSGIASVQRNHIEAVICLPIGKPSIGVVYLQAHSSGVRFPPEAKAWAERFVTHLTPIARRLVDAHRAPDNDPTRHARAELGGAASIIGKSPALAGALRWAATIAAREASVLLSGGAGVGKSLFASILATNGSTIVEDVDRLSPEAQQELAAKPGRIIATTRVPLAELRLADALASRLVATYTMPSLSERRSDVLPLAEHFLAEAAAKHGLTPRSLSATAQQLLLVADWPGEVRQLMQAIEGAALRAQADALAHVDPTCFFARAPDALGVKPIVAWQIAIRDCQRRILKEALGVTRGNVTEAARRLGIARSYAYELVRDLNLR